MPHSSHIGVHFCMSGKSIPLVGVSQQINSGSWVVGRGGCIFTGLFNKKGKKTVISRAGQGRGKPPPPAPAGGWRGRGVLLQSLRVQELRPPACQHATSLSPTSCLSESLSHTHSRWKPGQPSSLLTCMARLA